MTDHPDDVGLSPTTAAIANDPEGAAIPHASDRALAVTARLEHDLVDDRPVALGALLAAVALLRIGSVGAGAAIAFTLADAGTDTRVIGAVGSVNALAEFVFAMALARFADRLGRTRFLIGGPVVGALGVVLLALSGGVQLNLSVVAAARVFEGVAAAAFVPTALGTLAAATTHSLRVRAEASSLFEGATLAGYAIGGLAGGFAYHYAGRGAFPVLAAFYLAAAAVCAVWIPRIPPLPVSPLGDIVRAVTGPGPIRTFLPAWLASFAVIGAFLVNLPALLKHPRHLEAVIVGQSLPHHFDERAVVSMLTAGLACLVVGIALWTPLLPRWGAAITMRRAVPGTWIFCAGLILLNHVTGDVRLLLLPIVPVGIMVLAGFGPAAVTYLAECSETFAADRSALMAFYTLTLAAGGVAGSLVGGFAARALGIDGLALACMVFAAIAFAGLGRVVRAERLLVAVIES